MNPPLRPHFSQEGWKNRSFPEPLKALSVSENSAFTKFSKTSFIPQSPPRLTLKLTSKAWFTYGFIEGFLRLPTGPIKALEKIYKAPDSTVIKCEWNNRIIAVKKIKNREEAVTEYLALKSVQKYPEMVRLYFSCLSSQGECLIGESYYPQCLCDLAEINCRNILPWAIQLTRELLQLHRAQWSHHDIKFDNICIDGPRAHLIDFGSAQNRWRNPIHLRGSPSYFPPERWVRKTTFEFSDLWSLGIVFFNLSTFQDFLEHHPSDQNESALKRGQWYIAKMVHRLGMPPQRQTHLYFRFLWDNPYLKNEPDPKERLEHILNTCRPKLSKNWIELLKRLLSYENRPRIEEVLSILSTPHFSIYEPKAKSRSLDEEKKKEAV